ncbi:hypothetical protein CCP3SC1AL1_2120006 [Gammaproteobacteria bacterium]
MEAVKSMSRKGRKAETSKQSSISLKSKHLDGLDPPPEPSNVMLFPRERRGTLTWFHPDMPRKPVPLSEAEQTELTRSKGTGESEMSLKERIDKIKNSVDRINQLMAELKTGDTLNDTRNSGTSHRPS